MNNRLRVLYFIGSCLALDGHPGFREEVITRFAEAEADETSTFVEQFIWTCSNHLVLPVIYLKFKKHDLLPHLPELLAQHLEEIYHINRSRNEQILAQVREINATLNKSGIFPIYMKGTGNLIDGVYEDLGERIIGDIDLLVKEEDYLNAVALAKEIGYANYWGEPLNPKKVKHYPRLYKENVPADLEIHRVPVSQKYATHFSSKIVQQSKKLVVDFPACYVLADNHKVMLNFIHSQLSNSGHRLGIVSLRDIYDLYCFLKRIDLQQIVQVTPYPKKFTSYRDITCKLLRLPLLQKQNLTSKFFCWKHDLNHTSPLFNMINRFTWSITVLVFIVVPMKIREFIYYKKARKLLIKKIGRRSWYKQQINIYIKIVKG